MKRIILSLTTILLSVALYAQSEGDAMNLSRNDLTGTARGMGMAGAFGALGGDITGIAINPAGIGVYRSSEIAGTINLESVGSKTNTTDNKFTFSFDNIGYIGYVPTGEDGISRFNFGFTYNRLKNFNRKYRTSGVGLGGSLTDYMAWDIGETPEGNIGMDDIDDAFPFKDGYSWLGVLGYNGYLINPPKSGMNSDPKYYTSILESGETIDNNLLVSEEGSIASYDFTFGANVAELLSLGVAFSITDIDYKMTSAYFENFSEHGGDFRLDNWINTTGTGFGLKLGAILKPINELRLGVAYHSPTWYSVSDTYSAGLSHWNLYNEGGDTPASNLTEGYFRPIRYTPERLTTQNHYSEYRLNTPYAWVFSIAGVIDNWAVLSLDYEIKDYKSMNFAAPNNSNSFDVYDIDNENIDLHYRAASTVRAGFEFKVTPQVALRGGFSWAQSPLATEFKDNVGNVDKMADVFTAGSIAHHILPGDTYHYTFGFGYRFTPQFYLDVASVVKTQTDDLYAFPHLADNRGVIIESKPIELKSKVIKGLVTLGYKF